MAKKKTSKKEPAPLKHAPSRTLAPLWKKTVKLAGQLPGVEESRSYGTPALKVKGKFLARLRTEAEGGLAIHCDFVDRQMLVQADPEVFYVTDHYENYPMVLINLEKVRWDAMPGLLEAGWRQVASPALLKQLDERG